MKLHRFILTALLLLGFAGPAQADVLFSNLGQSDDGSASFDANGDPIASDFQTGGTPTTITSITVNMSNTSISLGLTLSLGIYTDNGSGQPGTLLQDFDNEITVPADDIKVNFTTTSSTGIALQANTIYWVVGTATSGDLGGTLYWNYSNSGATNADSVFSTVPGTQIMSKGPGGLVWSAIPGSDLLFELDGVAVPEPTGLALLVTAPIFGAVGAFGWWRRSRVALHSLPVRGHAG